MRVEKIFDVLVVGAGAAGLACARALSESDLDIAVLEARHRVGGRCYSVLPEDQSMPIELGAEFIHGEAPGMKTLLEHYHFPFFDVVDSHLVMEENGLRSESDYFSRMSEFISMLNPSANPDRPVGEFISNSLGKEDASLFRAFVEGFHAADVDRLSEAALARTEDPEDPSTSQCRLTHGYGSLMEAMAKDVRRRGIELHMNTTLKTICWEPDRVELRCRDEACDEPVKYVAKRVILTLPLGVLQAPSSDIGGLDWRPQPSQLREFCDAQAMGHVQRLAMRFHTRFWEALSPKKVSFLHAHDDRYFPTWWCSAPIHRPYLFAWQGGPRAAEMENWGHNQKIFTALSTLSHLTTQPISFLHDQLVESCSHDWSQDPFSRGAYSYIKVGGIEASKVLNEGLANTIFFAGEAMCRETARATVHGAIASGLHAARQVLATQVRMAA